MFTLTQLAQFSEHGLKDPHRLMGLNPKILPPPPKLAFKDPMGVVFQYQAKVILCRARKVG